MKNKLLRNGVEMPEVGFGTWKAGETDGFAVLSEAIRLATGISTPPPPTTQRRRWAGRWPPPG